MEPELLADFAQDWGIEETWYGWYSPRSHYLHGTVLYRTPAGTDVHVTSVNNSDTEHGSNWADIVCVGQITEYVSSGDEGKWPLLYHKHM
mgnify:CR=1 FL=1